MPYSLRSYTLPIFSEIKPDSYSSVPNYGINFEVKYIRLIVIYYALVDEFFFSDRSNATRIKPTT
ncbi:hypothetical protein NIES25_18810 [Nostoc linckia NIES-25]|nr:hypothetical protein NIES25_18810 [Nostoc linckia NIES-25]